MVRAWKRMRWQEQIPRANQMQKSVQFIDGVEALCPHPSVLGAPYPRSTLLRGSQGQERGKKLETNL